MRKLFPFLYAPMIETTTILRSFTSGCKKIDSLNLSSVIKFPLIDVESNDKMLTASPYFGFAMIGFSWAVGVSSKVIFLINSFHFFFNDLLNPEGSKINEENSFEDTKISELK